MKIYQSSRRTIMDGEVVTFATGFEGFGGTLQVYKANGPFEISASREMVMVHRAYFNTSESFEFFSPHSTMPCMRTPDSVPLDTEPNQSIHQNQRRCRMTKATAGERFAMRWFNVTLRVLVAWEDGHKLAKAADILLARERAKVAEDVLAIAARTDISIDDLCRLSENVRAKYGKGTR